MALAKLQLDDISGAIADLATANAFRDDDLTEENLALALIVGKRNVLMTPKGFDPPQQCVCM